MVLIQPVLIIGIVAILLLCYRKNRVTENTSNTNKWVEVQKRYNRAMLAAYGDSKYIEVYGVDAYEDVINDRDKVRFFAK